MGHSVFCCAVVINQSCGALRGEFGTPREGNLWSDWVAKVKRKEVRESQGEQMKPIVHLTVSIHTSYALTTPIDQT